jgi:hypothetical protein
MSDNVDYCPRDRDAPCPHCPDGHGPPNRCSWAVWLADEVDHDGQPKYLRVQPGNGAHVAEADARWLRRVIRERNRERDVKAPPLPLTYEELEEERDRLAFELYEAQVEIDLLREAIT